MSWDNSIRLNKFLDNSRLGIKTKVVYLGASITCGIYVKPEESFTKVFSEYLQETYAKEDNISFYVEAEPGITSQMAMIRSEEMVIAHEPDLVVIDFSVNDRREEVHRVTMESLVRKIITSKSKPAILMIGLRSINNYNCSGQIRAICSHYGLAFINVGEKLTDMLEKKEISWEEYSLDYLHPTRWGHNLIAQCMKEYIETFKPVEKVKQLMDPLFGDRFQQLAPVMNSYHVWNENQKESVIKKLTCKALYMVNIESNNEHVSSVEVYVDDEFLQRIDAYNSTGWDNPVVHLLLDKKQEAEHEIEIRPLNGGKGFTMLCLACC